MDPHIQGVISSMLAYLVREGLFAATMIKCARLYESGEKTSAAQEVEDLRRSMRAMYAKHRKTIHAVFQAAITSTPISDPLVDLNVVRDMIGDSASFSKAVSPDRLATDIMHNIFGDEPEPEAEAESVSVSASESADDDFEDDDEDDADDDEDDAETAAEIQTFMKTLTDLEAEFAAIVPAGPMEVSIMKMVSLMKQDA